MAAVLAIFSSLLWGSADFLGGTISRRRPAVLVVASSQTVGLLVILVVAIVSAEFDAPLGYLPWSLAAGLAGMIGLIAYFAALAGGTMGIVSPIAALGVAVPVVVSLVGGERPTALQLLGIVVAICGVVLASGPELSGQSGLRPLLLAGAAAVCFGLTLLFIALGSRSSAVMTLVGMRVAAVVVLGGVLGVMAVRARDDGGAGLLLSRRDVGLVALVGCGDVSANLTFGLASTRGLVSIVAVLGSLYPVMTAVLARLVHDERLRPVQVAGVAGALAGVAMMAAG